MTNIRELITTHSKAEKVLKLAGEVGSNLGKQVYVVGGFVRDIFMQKISKVEHYRVIIKTATRIEIKLQRIIKKPLVSFCRK